MADALAIALGALANLPPDRRQVVAIDGVDGAGKTTFADALANRLDRPSVRASVDGFHNPSAIRYRQGRDSPEGFYRDSFDHGALIGLLLEPFASGRPFCTRAFDYLKDEPVPRVMVTASNDALLLIDGIFLHRAELRSWWDLSIWLDVPSATASERLQRREGRPAARRYLEGQKLYIAEAEPEAQANLILTW